MDFNLEFKVLEQEEITEKEAYEMLNKFIEENQDVDEIYKIQSEEILAFLRRKSNISSGAGKNEVDF